MDLPQHSLALSVVFAGAFEAGLNDEEGGRTGCYIIDKRVEDGHGLSWRYRYRGGPASNTLLALSVVFAGALEAMDRDESGSDVSGSVSAEKKMWTHKKDIVKQRPILPKNGSSSTFQPVLRSVSLIVSGRGPGGARLPMEPKMKGSTVAERSRVTFAVSSETANGTNGTVNFSHEEAALAGNRKWGLDAGQHHRWWNVYLNLPTEWVLGRDYSESELEVRKILPALFNRSLTDKLSDIVAPSLPAEEDIAPVKRHPSLPAEECAPVKRQCASKKVQRGRKRK
ncbi:hypothetical protein F4604DRAFT_1917004 [Suillus subluteus]|nr:hypothetical protein F4604DRAFT_1917004 [Suillus subluteus]